MAKTFQMSRAMGGSQDEDYSTALMTCESADDVRALVAAYRELVLDAEPIAARMTAQEFTEFHAGLKKERRGKFAGETWAKKYGAILMPLPMMRITEIAAQFSAPFGVAWQRAKDLRPDLLTVEGTAG